MIFVLTELLFLKILDISFPFFLLFSVFYAVRNNPDHEYDDNSYEDGNHNIEIHGLFLHRLELDLKLIFNTTLFIRIVNFPRVHPLIKFLHGAGELPVTKRNSTLDVVEHDGERISSIIFFV